MPEKKILSFSFAGKTTHLHVGGCNRSLSLIIHKNQLQVDQRPYWKTQISATVRGMHRDSLSRELHRQELPEKDSNSSEKNSQK